MLRVLFLSVVVLLLVHVTSASAWAQCLSENNGPKDSTLQLLVNILPLGRGFL